MYFTASVLTFYDMTSEFTQVGRRRKKIPSKPLAKLHPTDTFLGTDFDAKMSKNINIIPRVTRNFVWFICLPNLILLGDYRQKITDPDKLRHAKSPNKTEHVLSGEAKNG